MMRIANGRAFAGARRVSILLLFVTIAFSAPLSGQQLTGAGTTASEPGKPAAPKVSQEGSNTALSQFAWLAGHWQGQWGPRLAQQVWMPAQSGTMVGVFQVSDNTQTQVVELYTIVSTTHGIELRIRRFTALLTPWEKSGPALLDLKKVDPKSILFENAKDGQPKSWLMTRTGPDTFVQKFEIVPEKGQQQVAEIVYHRQPAPAPPSR